MDATSFARSEVMSGVGVWTLLAALLAAADGDARRELAAATGLDRAEAGPSVRETMALLDRADGIATGLGIWSHRDVVLKPAFADSLPDLTVTSLPSDTRELDRWVVAKTGGLIERFPGTIDSETKLVVATALAAEADWLQPFTSGFGQWRSGTERFDWLYRSGTDLSQAALVSHGSSTISRVTCATEGSFDVHLVAGDEGSSPSAVLTTALAALSGNAEVVAATDLRRRDRGGCLVIERAPTPHGGPELTVSLPSFDLSSEHDLLAAAPLFGLETAQNTDRGHFPALADYPLAVQSALQSAMANFSATGF